jgi:hypothetical protein
MKLLVIVTLISAIFCGLVVAEESSTILQGKCNAKVNRDFSYQQNKFGLADEDIKKALELGRQYGFLGEAVKLMEAAINKYPKQKQEELRAKYKQVITNWKKGVMM